MNTDSLKALVLEAIDERKGQHPVVLDVRKLTDMTDWMVVASGTSARHVRSVGETVVEAAKAAGVPVGGMEGKEGGEWVLIDLYGVVVHVMLPDTRDFYRIEALWTQPDGVADSAREQ